MYIIKTHYEATEQNHNFAGAIKDFYIGKGGFIIGSENKFPSEYQIEHCGYSTLAAAKKGLKSAQECAEWETRNGWWIVTAELVKC